MVSVSEVQRGERIQLNMEWGCFAIQWRHLNIFLSLHDLTDYLVVGTMAVLFITAGTNRLDVSKVLRLRALHSLRSEINMRY